MELTVSPLVLIADVVLFIAIGYAFLFFFRRRNRYDPELNWFMRTSSILLFLALIGRFLDVIDDVFCADCFYYIEAVLYFVSTVGLVFAVARCVPLVERRYIPTPPANVRRSPVGAHIVFSKNRLLDVIEMLKDMSFKVLAVTRSPGIYEGHENVTPIWVTNVEGGVKPTALHVLQDAILRFVMENPGSVVVIDCLEYLLLYNDFKTVFKFLINLKDHVVVNHGSGLVVFVDDTVLSEQEKALLLKEFEPL